MRSPRIFSVASAIAVLFVGGIAQARPDDTYQSKQTGTWSATSSWQYWDGSSWQNALSVPNAGDTVTVLNSHVITVSDSQEVTVVTVAAGGQLAIDGASGAPAQLKLTGSAAMTVNQANGVQLVDRFSTLAFAAGLAVGGSGSIQGLATQAVIDLQPANGVTVELQNNVPFVGAMTIKKTGAGTGNFKNGSIVRANIANEGILLDASLSNLLVEASAGGCNDFRWSVEGANRTLVFGIGSTSLIGYFQIDAGTLTVNANVTTSGKKHQINSGVINGSATFVASGGTCP